MWLFRAWNDGWRNDDVDMALFDEANAVGEWIRRGVAAFKRRDLIVSWLNNNQDFLKILVVSGLVWEEDEVRFQTTLFVFEIKRYFLVIT